MAGQTEFGRPLFVLDQSDGTAVRRVAGLAVHVPFAQRVMGRVIELGPHVRVTGHTDRYAAILRLL